jgi:hypothetical protein
MDGGGWLTARPGRLTSREGTLYSLYRRGCMCPRAGSGGCGKSRRPPGFDPRTVKPVASRYTDWAVPAHTVWLLRRRDWTHQNSWNYPRFARDSYPTRLSTEFEFLVVSLPSTFNGLLGEDLCSTVRVWHCVMHQMTSLSVLSIFAVFLLHSASDRVRADVIQSALLKVRRCQVSVRPGCLPVSLMWTCRKYKETKEIVDSFWSP